MHQEDGHARDNNSSNMFATSVTSENDTYQSVSKVCIVTEYPKNTNFMNWSITSSKTDAEDKIITALKGLRQTFNITIDTTRQVWGIRAIIHHRMRPDMNSRRFDQIRCNSENFILWTCSIFNSFCSLACNSLWHSCHFSITICRKYRYFI